MFPKKNYLDFQTQLFLNPNFIFSKYVSISNLNPVADWNKKFFLHNWNLIYWKFQ